MRLAGVGQDQAQRRHTWTPHARARTRLQLVAGLAGPDSLAPAFSRHLHQQKLFTPRPPLPLSPLTSSSVTFPRRPRLHPHFGGMVRRFPASYYENLVSGDDTAHGKFLKLVLYLVRFRGWYRHDELLIIILTIGKRPQQPPTRHIRAQLAWFGSFYFGAFQRYRNRPNGLGNPARINF